jgi:hypothetical protein
MTRHFEWDSDMEISYLENVQPYVPTDEILTSLQDRPSNISTERLSHMKFELIMDRLILKSFARCQKARRPRRATARCASSLFSAAPIGSRFVSHPPDARANDI